MRTPENIEKQAVKKYLDEIGAFHRWPVPNGYGKPDIDCHASIFGSFWCIEIKKPGAEPTPAQYRTLKEAACSDANVVWGTAEIVVTAIQNWMKRRIGTSVVGEIASNVHSPLEGSHVNR